MTNVFARIRRTLRTDRRGNVFMIMGFAMLPLTFSVGMGIDYARAARMQTRLNALADAAALTTVTTPMMQQTTAVAATAAYNSWTQQSSGLGGMLTTYAAGSITTVTAESAATHCPSGTGNNITVTDMTNGTLEVCVKDNNSVGHTRTTTVTWHADSKNSIANMLGYSKIELTGTSTTAAKQAPNIDFYVLLDTSGSMAFPSTSAGITQLRSLTGGCAFACHNTNDSKATAKDGSQQDYYGVAVSYGIPLRITEARKAVQSMMSTATTTENNNNAVYRGALYSFASKDSNAYNGFKTLQTVTSTLSSVSSAANNATTSFYYSNSNNYNNANPPAGYNNNDTDTATSDAFTRMNNLMPAPGNGSNVAGDKPQQILFIITDGMRDETRSSGRPEIAIDTSLCDTIKARGIRIGILYTQYLQSSMDGDSWSQSNVVPYLNQVQPALQACASSGLFYTVTTDDDISAALNQLFQAAVATAHITQ